jgi:hypothetical protein
MIWIAILALVVGLASLGFTALERRARVAELDLLRRQVEGEERDREHSRRASVVGAHGQISGGRPSDQHDFFLMNSGPAVARAVDVWPQDDATGEIVTAPQRVAPALIPNAPPTEIRIEVPHDASRRGGLTLWARWRDDTGTRTESLLPLKQL